MTTVITPTPVQPVPPTGATAARAAGEAAARAGIAASTAAAAAALTGAIQNASKPGFKSSEFKVAAGSILLTGLAAALHSLPYATLFGPWAVPVVGLATGLMAGLYALSRGTVKAAALTAGSTALATLAATPIAVHEVSPKP